MTRRLDRWLPPAALLLLSACDTPEEVSKPMNRALALGRKALYPIKDIGDAGQVAEIEDSEGNRLALNQPK